MSTSSDPAPLDLVLYKRNFVVPLCWACRRSHTDEDMPDVIAGMHEDDIATELGLEENERLAEDLHCFQCGTNVDLDEGFWTITVPPEDIVVSSNAPPRRGSRRIGPELQRYIRARDRGICGLCGRGLRRSECTGHHIQPWSKDGKTSAENLIVACDDCQQRIADRHLPVRYVVDTEFIRELSPNEIDRIYEIAHTDAELEALIKQMQRMLGIEPSSTDASN